MRTSLACVAVNGMMAGLGVMAASICGVEVPSWGDTTIRRAAIHRSVGVATKEYGGDYSPVLRRACRAVSSGRVPFVKRLM